MRDEESQGEDRDRVVVGAGGSVPARDRLLRAMVDAIWERGYGSASVGEICREAEVGRGSFYHFFPSKSALAVAALEHLWETRSRPVLEDVFAAANPPLVRFERLIEYWYRATLECRRERGRVLGCPYFNVGAEAAAVAPELAEKIREILACYQDYLEVTLREAVERGEVAVDDASETAASLFSMIEGCSVQARIHDDPERVRVFAGTFARVIGAELAPDFEASPVVA